MYATAHKVVRFDGSEGINSFLHLHGTDFEWPEDSSTLPEDNPGQLGKKEITIPPGGNRVRSYLDLLAPDGLHRDTIIETLKAFEQDLGERRNPTVFHLGTVTVRYGVEDELITMRKDEFILLQGVVLRLLMK